MATNASRKARGSETQNAAAAWYRDNGFPYCESAGAGRQGRDLLGMPGLAGEVKARADLAPMAWLRQAEAAANGDLPFVLWRPNGFGTMTIPLWGVFLRNGDFTRLIREAGYGIPVGAAE